MSDVFDSAFNNDRVRFEGRRKNSRRHNHDLEIRKNHERETLEQTFAYNILRYGEIKVFRVQRRVRKFWPKLQVCIFPLFMADGDYGIPRSVPIKLDARVGLRRLRYSSGFNGSRRGIPQDV